MSVAYLRQNVRPFEFAERPVEKAAETWLDNLVITVARFVQTVSGVTHVAYGVSRGDTELGGKVKMVRDARAVFYKEMDRLKSSAMPDVFYPMMDVSKKEMVAMLPKELLDLTWTCLHPMKNGKRFCGCCSSCRQMKKEGVSL
jgi:7-cyano-7-deazaguanine synthase in queuosine biosynthesis